MVATASPTSETVQSGTKRRAKRTEPILTPERERARIIFEQHLASNEKPAAAARKTTAETGFEVNRNTARRWAQEVKHDERRQPKAEPRPPVIEGVTLDGESVDINELWNTAFKVYDAVAEVETRRRDQRVVFPGDQPIGIAYLSDMHFGNKGTDYRSAREDAEIIRDTPGMYAVYHGDGTDNWIMGKLQGLQRGQAVPFDGEIALHRDYLDILREKLIVVVPGNHDLWTRKIAGLEYIHDHLAGTRILYHPFQVVFDLHLGATRLRHIVRHKYRFNSVFNPTHGQEVSWGRGDVDFDVAIGGHTHTGTLVRPFYAHGRMRLAVQTGAYKRVDGWAEEIGFSRTPTNGCGALIYYPDGRISAQYDMQTAAEFLTYLRSK